jgi:hypothetical protein
MDIVEDIVDEDAAVEDTEGEATAEMANQDADVADIEAEATHKQLCSNCIWQTQRHWTNRAFLSLYQKLSTICYFGRCGSKTVYLPLIRKFSPFNWG